MSAASDYLENKVLDHILRNNTYTQPSGLYVGLFTASTGLETDSPSAEVSTSGTGYGRKQINFAAAVNGTAASNGTTTNNGAAVTFDPATSSWGTITHIAVMDASTGGHVLFWGAVTTSKTIDSGDTFQISNGNLTVSLA